MSSLRELAAQLELVRDTLGRGAAHVRVACEELAEVEAALAGVLPRGEQPELATPFATACDRLYRVVERLDAAITAVESFTGRL